MDRSSRPLHSPPAAVIDQPITLRQTRKTYRHIAQVSGMTVSTVGRLLKHIGLNRLSALEPALPIVRYPFERPGDLLPLDLKTLGRFRQPGHRMTKDRQRRSRGAGSVAGSVHVAIDPHSPVAFTSIHPDETGRVRLSCKPCAIPGALDLPFTRGMTDTCYTSRRFRRVCQRLGLRHIRTKPYTPQTNGKAKRFIQTSLREGASAYCFQTSEQRAAPRGCPGCHLPAVGSETPGNRSHEYCQTQLPQFSGPGRFTFPHGGRGAGAGP